MGKFTESDGIAIWKLAYYAPCLVASLFVAFRHGFMKSSGWIFLIIFTVLRIIGSAAQLAAINSKSSTAYTIAAVTSSIGLSPLLLASLGLLARSFYSILKQPLNTIFNLVLLKAIQVPAAVGLILCIVGATSASTPAQIDSEMTVHIGIILFAVVLAALIGLDVAAAIGYRTTKRGEGGLILAVGLALPFLVTRIAYSLLAVFSHDKRFNVATGSTNINLCMAVLPECVVVLIYLSVGLKLSALPANRQSESTERNLAYRAGRGDFGTGRLGMLSMASAVVHAVNGKDSKVEDQENGTTRNPSRYQGGHSQQQRGYGLQGV